MRLTRSSLRERAEVIRRDAAMHREALGLPARFFLFAGRLVPEKGIFDLLRAYSALAPEIRKKMGLVFVGDGAARSALLQACDGYQSWMRFRS